MCCEEFSTRIVGEWKEFFIIFSFDSFISHLFAVPLLLLRVGSRTKLLKSDDEFDVRLRNETSDNESSKARRKIDFFSCCLSLDTDLNYLNELTWHSLQQREFSTHWNCAEMICYVKLKTKIALEFFDKFSTISTQIKRVSPFRNQNHIRMSSDQTKRNSHVTSDCKRHTKLSTTGDSESRMALSVTIEELFVFTMRCQKNKKLYIALIWINTTQWHCPLKKSPAQTARQCRVKMISG